MNPPVGGHHLAQSLHIGGVQLGELAVVQHRPHDLVLGAQLFQHVHVGGPARLGFLHRGQAQLVKEDMAQLLGGEDVELLPGQPVDLRLERVDAQLELPAEVGQGLGVHQHARPLHPGQHRAQGKFNVRQDGQQAELLQFRLKQPVKHLDPGGVLVPGGLGLETIVQQGEGRLVLVGGGLLHLLLEVGHHQLAQLVAPGGGVEKVRRQLRVEHEALRLDPLVQQGAAQLLRPVSHLVYPGAEQGGQQGVVVPLVGGGADVVQVRLALPAEGHRHPRQIRQGQDGRAVRPLPPGQGGGKIRLGAHGDHGDLDLRPLLGRVRPGGAGGELQLVDELGELQVQQGLVQRRIVEGLTFRVRRVEAHGRVAADGGQLLAEPRAVRPLGELLHQPRLGGGVRGGADVRHMVVEVLHRVVELHQGQGGLFPHPFDTRVVVGGIPHEGLQVDHVHGVKAVFRPERLRGHVPGGGLAHAGGHQLHGGAAVHQLEGVLVPGDDHRIAPLSGVHPGHGAQQVVRLPALQLVPADVHGVQHLLQHRHLHRQLLRHPLALGLVLGEGPVPEGGRAHIEGPAPPASPPPAA